MSSGGHPEYVLYFFIGVAALVAIHAWVSDKSTRLKENEHNRSLRSKLDERERQLDQKTHEFNALVKERLAFLTGMREAFASGYIAGRRWLAKFVADADKALDESISYHLRNKKRPALKASEEVAAAKAEKRFYKEKAAFLEAQLRSLKEYFPQLEEYEDIILDEAVPLTVTHGKENIDALEASDPVLQFVQKTDYEKLRPAERNQLALDRYLTKNHSTAAIGRFYERFLGYNYERDGWKVEYQGIMKGYEDLGRDLICRKGTEVQIVQAKCWAADKMIHEKHIFQLFGTTQLFLMSLAHADLVPPKVTPVFITTTSLSDVARQAAAWLKIEVKEKHALEKRYPMIKCNISMASGERIYHLPFDLQYDRTKISTERGEFYASTTAEAEAKGFRRAFRYTGSFA